MVGIKEESRNDRKLSGDILYHKFETYDEVRTKVLFTVSGTQRFVSSVDTNVSAANRGEAGPSSWVFVEEPTPEEEDFAGPNSAETNNRIQLRSQPTGDEAIEEDGEGTIMKKGMAKGKRDNGGSVVNRRSSKIQRPRRSSVLSKSLNKKTRTSTTYAAKKSSKHPAHDSTKKAIKVSAKKSNNSVPDDVISQEPESLSGDDGNNDPRFQAEVQLPSDSNYSTEVQEPVVEDVPLKTTVVGGSSAQVVSQEQESDLLHRLRLLEERLSMTESTGGNQQLSASSMYVLVSLRWSLLKSLEKPLKVLELPGLSQHGLDHRDLVVSTHCDYNAFKEIAAVLEKEHRSSANGSGKRVAFSPPFSTTQSGSTASNDLNILFSCLSDIATFLRIRDDADFERILSKEVISGSTTILRMLGTFSGSLG